VARIGVSITKTTPFRLSNQEFSNVYYYDVSGLPDSAQSSTIIDNLTALEKTFHGTNVTFVRGRLWSQGATPADSNMIHQKTLSGTGARAATSALDKERAYLFRIRAGVDSRGTPVYLRKWYHACAEFVSGQAIATDKLDNTGGWTQAQRDAQVAAMQAIGNANGSPLSPVLVAKSGRTIPAGNTWSAHQFLEHHQLGDQWRAL